MGQEVEHAGQPVGVVVATSQELATKAAAMVHVSYVDFASDKGLLTIEDVLASDDKSRILQSANVVAESEGV